MLLSSKFFLQIIDKEIDSRLFNKAGTESAFCNQSSVLSTLKKTALTIINADHARVIHQLRSHTVKRR